MLLCVVEAHNVAACPVYKQFMVKMRSDRVSQLKAALWKTALLVSETVKSDKQSNKHPERYSRAASVPRMILKLLSKDVTEFKQDTVLLSFSYFG